jgi:TonB family protein
MTALGRAAAFSGCLLLSPCLSGYGAAFAAPAQPQRTPEQVGAIKAWNLQISRQIESKKRYPAAALLRREQGTVVIRFRLDRQGQLVSTRILRTSGIATLDNAGLALVRQAQPFPPPPPLAALQFDVPIRYWVNRPLLPRCTLLNRLLGPCTSP